MGFEEVVDREEEAMLNVLANYGSMKPKAS